jgi:hypothetical protein
VSVINIPSAKPVPESPSMKHRAIKWLKNRKATRAVGKIIQKFFTQHTLDIERDYLRNQILTEGVSALAAQYFDWRRLTKTVMSEPSKIDLQQILSLLLYMKAIQETFQQSDSP